MNFLLDTNIIVEILRGNYEVQQRTYGIGLQKCFISEYTMAELYTGANKSNSQTAFQQLETIEQLFRIIPFGKSFKKYGEIRAKSEQSGIRMDDMDLLIASVAIEHKLTLVTHNQKHFQNIPELKLADFIK